MFSALKHFSHLGLIFGEPDELRPPNVELREDGAAELREDGTYELRE